MRVLNGLNEQDWMAEAARVGCSPAQLRPWRARPELVAFAGRLTDSTHGVRRLEQWLSHRGGCLLAAGRRTGGERRDVLAFVPRTVLQKETAGNIEGEGRGGSEPAELAAFQQAWSHFQRSRWVFRCRHKELVLDRPLVMGILNVTPDSFSDGGRFLETDRALARAREMIAQGAAIIDVGGESTRPGAEPVSAEEEWRRIGPVVEALVSEGQCLVSVDTYKSVVARQALEAGAHLINDISGLNFDPHMADVVADYQVPLVLMHIQGTPQNMQRNPQYTHLVEEVFEFLFRAVARARAQGIEQLLVDPGIGFGKRWEDNFELIRRIGEFRSLGYPILLGTSRKSFLGRLLDVPPADRLYGNLSVTIFSALQGVRVFRVHDVRPTVEALDTLRAVLEKKIPPAAQEGVS